MDSLTALRELHPRHLTRRQRLILVFFCGLVALVLTFTGVYYWGMRALENEPRSVFQAFNTVIETLTTTGYGADSPWATPQMNLFVATMQITGIAIGLVTLRVLVIPLFENTPLNLDGRLSLKDDHVVLAEYERDTGVLLDELEALGVDYVLIESDVEEAKRLSDEGYQAIDGDPEARADLDRATIGKATTLLTDAGDSTASVVLTALEANEDLRVISFTASTRRKAALAEIGVDRSIAPHALIGQRLAEKATTPVLLDLPGDDEAIVIREILVRRESPLHGARIGDSPVVAHPELTLVAGWFDGVLRFSPSVDERLTANTVLVIAGPERAMAAVSTEVAGVRPSRISTHSRVIIAGLGEGGTAAAEVLSKQASVTTVDASGAQDPDIVGDVTEPETLDSAGVDDASALVVTVGDDATALLAVAMARSLAPNIEILARVTNSRKVSAAFRAGADYVLSVQQVCARLVAAEVHGERVMDPVNQIRLVRADADSFAGETLRTARRNASGWSVVGVTRGGRVLTDERTTIEPDDEIFVAGSDVAIREFERTEDTS
jgi:Trk K+ transport system NAD-binding subunit